MDPAGPLFFNDVPAPFNGYNCTSASRLNRTDAKFVDVIHTDGNSYTLNDWIYFFIEKNQVFRSPVNRDWLIKSETGSKFNYI